jgi:hypothetical protein
MRYSILKPPVAFDPRNREFKGLLELYDVIPVVTSTDLESDAADDIFEDYPDALAFPCPIKVGSGTIWMMGILASSSTPRDPDGEIPFVAFVMAQAEREREKKLLASHAHWNKKLWKSPVMLPNDMSASTTPVEVRGTDLDHPAVVEGTFGRTPDGRSVIHCELNGVAVSFTCAGRPLVKHPSPRPTTTERSNWDPLGRSCAASFTLPLSR